MTLNELVEKMEFNDKLIKMCDEGDDSDDQRWFVSPAMWWNPIAWLIALCVEEEIHLHGPNEYHISECGLALVILFLGAIFIAFLVVSGNL